MAVLRKSAVGDGAGRESSMKKPISDPLLSVLLNDARSRRISRRTFMQGALAAGLAVPAAELLWTTEVRAAEPKRGGLFRAGLHDGSTTDSLDPATAISIFAVQLNNAARSFLTEISPTNEISGDAAESWEASSDAKQWRFKLVQGIEFHNGKPLTAKDVIATLNYHRADSSTSAAKPLLADVTSVEADGDHTVVITLKTGNADMPFIMSDYHLGILPADGEGTADAASGIGSGPYKIERFQAGVAADLVRHEKYHRADQAFFDGVRLISLTDSNARHQAITTGEIDAVTELDLRTLHLLAKNPQVKIDEVPGGTYNGMPMNCKVAPFDNPDFRLALKYILDREEILKKILFGHATIGNDQPVCPIMPYYAANIPQRPYDPDKAKHHLQKSGLGNVKIQLSAGDAAFAGSVDMGLLFQATARQIGIDIEVVREPADGYWTNVWQKKPFVVVANGQRPTPDMIFSLFFQDGAPWNDTGWSQERFQSLLIQAKAEIDQAKRAEMYHEMQQICSDEGGTLIPFFRNKVTARRATVAHGPNISSAWELDGGKAYQRWWFEA